MNPWIILTLLLIPSVAGAACFEQAAHRYQVPVEILKAISTVESNGNPNAVNTNKNGSVDIGHMQINDWWLPKLEPYGITKEKLNRPLKKCSSNAPGS